VSTSRLRRDGHASNEGAGVKPSREVVKICSVHGAHEYVFRDQRRCDRCHWYESRDSRRGYCRNFWKITSARFISCQEFLATDEGLTTALAETHARCGHKICRVIYDGRALYVDRAAFIRALGYDPDDD
jgi:hypothetical protein